jgi:hypothetical protein
MKDINYYIQKINSIDTNQKYSSEEKQFVANYFYNLFEELSKMNIIEDSKKRNLSEIEKFLFIYIDIASKVKDHNDNNTSHDIIGSILTNTAVCQGYTSIMQFVCEELSIPFLYKTTEGPFGAHGNFQVIVKDKTGITHCLHCDPYLDAPDNENDTITFNATLISANDMNNYHNHQEPSSEFLFWELALNSISLEEKINQLESLSIVEQFGNTNLEEAIAEHYNSLKKDIIQLNNFFNCNIGKLETRQDILNAYQTIKEYYSQINIPISRENLYDMIEKIYISYNISILNMNNEEAVNKAKETINKQIENTDKKHKASWTK